MSENMNQRRGDAQATWPLCWVEVDSLEALRRLVRDDAYASAFQDLTQYRGALLQHLKKWAVAEASRQGAVRTWRQRIGVGKDWPLHAPNDVERAMVAEIAELRLATAKTKAPQTSAARDVLAERQRQVDEEGYDTEGDDGHILGELGAYAAFYAMPPAARDWPAGETGYGATWGEAIVPADWTPPNPGDRRDELVRAAALVLAEIERLDRATQLDGGQEVKHG
jgi:hypothetical protein